MGRHIFGHQLPVRAPPAVDALFDIPDKEILKALRVTVGDQGLKVVPLHSGSVLELVQEEMLEAYPEFLVDERSVGPVDDVLEQDVGIIDAEDILLQQKKLEFPAEL